jgi:hypothetical protein
MLIQVLGHVGVTQAGATVALPGAIPARILALLKTNLESGLALLQEGRSAEAAVVLNGALARGSVRRHRRLCAAGERARPARPAAIRRDSVPDRGGTRRRHAE